MSISRAGVLRALRGRRAPVRSVEHGPASTVIAVAVLVGIAVILVAGLFWRLERGTWAVIETGSMGTAAPVGTLIFTQSEPIALVEVGDVVSYHPRQNPREIITHRVMMKTANGDLVVRGDINGAADPYPVRGEDLVGTVVLRLIGVGWLVKALPSLVLAGVVVYVTTRIYVRPYWRSAVRVLASCLLACLATLVLRPFVHPVLISVRDQPGTQPTADVVSAGLLPTRVDGVPGHFVDLLVGETGSVAVRSTSPGAPYHITGHPHLDLPWLVLVASICAVPLLWCLLVGLSPDEAET